MWCKLANTTDFKMYKDFKTLKDKYCNEMEITDENNESKHFNDGDHILQTTDNNIGRVQQLQFKSCFQ